MGFRSTYIYDVLKTSNLRSLEDVGFTPRQKKRFFLILYCLKYLKFLYSSQISIKVLSFVNYLDSLTTSIQKNQKLACKITREGREEILTFT